MKNMHKKSFNTLNNALRKQSIKVESENLEATRTNSMAIARGKTPT